MAKKTNSSAQSSSQNSHAHKTIPDPTQPPPLPSKPSSLSSQPQPLSTSNSPRPNRSKKPTPIAAAAAAAAESSKRSQRVCFTSDDVLLILRSLSDFKSKTGKDPLKHLTDFHDSLKSALRIKTTERKLREKIRTLRIKFEKQRENSEENINFSCPLEEEAFELSKKFWGQENEVEEEDEKSPEKENTAKKLMLEEPPKKENAAKKLMLEEPPKKENAAKKPSTSKKLMLGEPSKNENAAKKPSISNKPMLVNAAKKPSTSKKPIQEELSSVVDKEPAKVGSSDKTGHLSLSEMFRFDEMRMDVNVLKRGMELIGESEREELEKRWKKLKVQEAEVFLKRAELAVDQGRLILKELKRSS